MGASAGSVFVSMGVTFDRATEAATLCRDPVCVRQLLVGLRHQPEFQSEAHERGSDPGIRLPEGNPTEITGFGVEKTADLISV